MPRKSLQAGYCSYPGSYCALEETDCLSGADTFSSSRQMQSTPGAHGGSCLLQEFVKEIVLGKCGEGGRCSPNAASCDGSALSSYVKDDITDPTCTIGSTKFGKCGDRCSWSPQDCNDGEQWTFPDNECTCDIVRVGGCVKDGFTYCSVSNLACDTTSVWFGPTAITAETGNICYICRQPTTDDDGVHGNFGGGTDDDGEDGTMYDDGVGGTNDGEDGGMDDDRVGGNYVGGGMKGSSKKSSAGAIVGGSLAGVAGAAAVIAAFVLVKYKRSNKVKRPEAPVTIPSTDDGNEDVSVL